MNALSTPDAPELLTVAEAAVICHVSAPTIRRRIAEGELPAVQVGGPGKSVRIRRDVLEKWLYGPPKENATA
jgi:excisionase family DNA binding protein